MSAPTPDQDRDVIVHGITLVDALTGTPVGHRWSVWIGREHEGSFDTEGDALALALEVAGERGLPAWLVRDGRPPTAIDGGDVSPPLAAARMRAPRSNACGAAGAPNMMRLETHTSGHLAIWLSGHVDCSGHLVCS